MQNCCGKSMTDAELCGAPEADRRAEPLGFRSRRLISERLLQVFVENQLESKRTNVQVSRPGWLGSFAQTSRLTGSLGRLFTHVRPLKKKEVGMEITKVSHLFTRTGQSDTPEINRPVGSYTFKSGEETTLGGDRRRSLGILSHRDSLCLCVCVNN